MTNWVAFSGGVDSCVLLHLLQSTLKKSALKAVHINHQLLPESVSWEKHCRSICKNLNIPLKIIRVTIIKKPGESLEAKAREARYAAFKKILKKNDILFTAHHQEDQAETVLLQLFRGAGLRGVSAMPKIMPFGQGRLYRPLLMLNQQFILDYAKSQNLHWLDDPSNQNTQFDRNYLRHQVLPVLQQRWPKISKILARFSQHCAEQEKILMDTAANDISCADFKTLSPSRQKNILRYQIKHHKLPVPGEKILDEILKIVSANTDRNPCVKWPGGECLRFKYKLYFRASPLLSPKFNPQKLNPQQLSWCKKYLHPKKFTVKFRQGGEKFKPANSARTRTLKNLFQEWKIPPWERPTVPLAYQHNKLIAVIGYAV